MLVNILDFQNGSFPNNLRERAARKYSLNKIVFKLRE